MNELVKSAGLSELDELCVQTIRFLSVDGVQKANSGHPGMPMGMAPAAYVLWTRHLKFNPANPGWHNREKRPRTIKPIEWMGAMPKAIFRQVFGHDRWCAFHTSRMQIGMETRE